MAHRMGRGRGMITRYNMKKVLRYHPSSGALYWLMKGMRGKVAGHVGTDGYLRVGYQGFSYLSHRLIWFYVHGYWSDKAIDHINLNKTDNRLVNLREATRNENQFNSLVRNKLGVKGVWQNHHKFQAKATLNGVYHYLGNYATVNQAKRVYDEFAKKHHGQFYARSKT